MQTYDDLIFAAAQQPIYDRPHLYLHNILDIIHKDIVHPRLEKIKLKGHKFALLSTKDGVRIFQYRSKGWMNQIK